MKKWASFALSFMSPSELVTIWKLLSISSVFISVTIWICHHLKNFQTCHRLDMKIEDFDFHTELSDGDKCHHLKARYENFSYLSPKNAFRWWRFDRNYHRALWGTLYKFVTNLWKLWTHLKKTGKGFSIDQTKTGACSFICLSVHSLEMDSASKGYTRNIIRHIQYLFILQSNDNSKLLFLCSNNNPSS